MLNAAREEQEFRRLADDAPVMIWRAGSKARDFFNKTWLAFTGRCLDEERGAGWAEGVHPEDRDRCLAAFEAAFDARQDVSITYRLRRHDGAYRRVLDKGRPSFDDEGRFRGTVGACIDVTEMQEAEDGLRQALDERQKLLRDIQHRLRNNLQLIASLLALQADDAEGPEARTKLAEAAARVRSIALAQQRLQDPKVPEIDFAAYLKALADSVASMDEREGLAFEVAADPIRLDLDRAVPLGLAVNELLTNAARHAFPDGAGGTVRVEARQAEDGTLSISVADDGIGLPESIDIDRPRSLGFRLLKRLTVQVRARVEVERGQGTRFRLTLSPAWRGETPARS